MNDNIPNRSSNSTVEFNPAILSKKNHVDSEFQNAMYFVFSRLSQRDKCIASCVCKEWHRISNHFSFWKILDLHGTNDAGFRLTNALNQSRFQSLEEINLEFSQGIDDSHFENISNKFPNTLHTINLNGCQKISDYGLSFLFHTTPNLKKFSIYWNLKISDASLFNISKFCASLTHLNVSGCKNISDDGLIRVVKRCFKLESLNLTRCIKLSDNCLRKISASCSQLEELYLYALSNFTDFGFEKFENLKKLALLDICGMQHLTDDGLSHISKCKNLKSLNLTWCIQLTDKGLCELAKNCTQLQLLSVHGILGLSDAFLLELSKSCSASLNTLDVNGCANIHKRSREDLLHLFPKLNCFKVHF